jgi:hypothetical protein
MKMESSQAVVLDASMPHETGCLVKQAFHNPGDFIFALLIVFFFKGIGILGGLNDN